jgi:Ca2+-dependent lipid-binding protein
VISNNLNPVWKEEFAFNNVAADARISLQCWDQDLGFSDDAMGVWISLPIGELCRERGVGVNVVAQLVEVKHGKIHLQVTWG